MEWRGGGGGLDHTGGSLFAMETDRQTDHQQSSCLGLVYEERWDKSVDACRRENGVCSERGRQSREG